MSWVAEAAQVTSTAFAAAAAGAAWISVRNGQRMFRATIEPDLHLQILMDETNSQPHLVITNTGGGVAKGAAYTIAVGAHHGTNWLGDGFIAPGDKIVVSPDMPADGRGYAVVMYRTADESSWVATADGRRVRLRKGSKGAVATSAAEVWSRAYPDVPLAGKRRATRVRVEWVEKRGVVVARRPDVPGL